jgi:geranylgeranyl pyrophosphate synthase
MAETTQIQTTEQAFADWVSDYTTRVTECLERALPAASKTPHKLHEAMRYAVFSGGKRVRPLLIYASGECLGVSPEKLDTLATAIELIHAFSLVHDDLPAMDNDDLRRGQPTVHRRFDEATAILAADALQPLAFQVIATSPVLSDTEIKLVVQAVAQACGSLGVTGGQSIDLASEGRILSVDELAQMYNLKTGALFRACVMSTTCLAGDLSTQELASLDQFSRDIGLAFQIRDDILDVKGETAVIGKNAGADQRMAKATWPALFGLEESVDRCDELVQSALQNLSVFAGNADSLKSLANYIVERIH